jgi:hypothetical protein
LRGADAAPYDEDVFASQLQSSRTAQTQLVISTTLLDLVDDVEPTETAAEFYDLLGSAGAFLGQAPGNNAACQPCLSRLGEKLEAIKSEIVDESNGWLPEVGVTAEWRLNWESTIYSTFYAPQRAGMAVNGQLKLPVGGRENCPLVANKNCPVADTNLPMRVCPPPVVEAGVRSGV